LDGEIDRDRVIELMAEAYVETTIGTYACHQHPAFEPWTGGATFPNSASHADRSLTLPLVPGMDRDQVERVVGLLAEVIRQA
ncbi:MAG: DegT/DnrJ/EryC1/StrS family aminotransferase, partial [Actinomycetota bacterium]|nr:DegT/DnrJ/EryC1/StrS family aminotransferase [Actinomycetota bacterium]